MGAVYRAYDRFEKVDVALKQVNRLLSGAPFSTQKKVSDERTAIVEEFRTLASLRHPRIISVLDYGFDVYGQPFFTMSLLEGGTDLVTHGRGKPDAVKAGLIVQTLQALAYLHQRGILHCDIKPANVLVTTTGEVKVLDFGLATGITEARGAGGTLAYMAPEVLMEKPFSPTADLYSVGIMAYELFAEQHPFELENVGKLMQQLLYDVPDYARVPQENLRMVLARWLAKDPLDRYPSADAAIIALCTALDIRPPVETTAIRESFLQRSRLVGRDAELAELTDQLAEVMQGATQVSLIGGESGIGKSRLLDELRIAALVQGAVVIRGQATENGPLLQIWRNIVRRLLLLVEVDDLDAAVLRVLVPDIAELIGREVGEAPQLSGQAQQERLVLTIVGLLRRVETPVVLLLEDLQWAQDSLAPLRQILKIRDQLSNLMVAASYRSDETPDLPAQLGEVHLILLERLGKETIRQLSIAMLGQRGQDEEIIELLTHETEGNIFFVVETVRALAEEAGSLNDIGTHTLPPSVFTGKMQQLMRRRLDRVSSDFHVLQTMAAIFGREIDVGLLGTVYDENFVYNWLIDAAANAVVEIQDNRWRFAHDKIRDAILRQLPDDERPEWHRRAARSIEATYPDDETMHERLLNHWRVAGNQGRVTHYAGLVAETLIRTGRDYPRAIRLLREALQTDGLSEREQFNLLSQLGRAHTAAGELRDGEGYARESLALAETIDDPRLILQARDRLGTALNAIGEYPQARSLSEAGYAMAQDIGDEYLTTSFLAGMGYSDTKMGDLQQGRELLYQALDRWRALGDQFRMVLTLTTLGITARALGNYDEQEALIGETIQISHEIGDYFGTAASSVNLSVLYALREDYEQAIKRTEEGYNLFQKMGEQRGMAVALSNLGRYVAYSRDSFEGTLYVERALDMHRDLGSRSSIAKCLQYLGEITLADGTYEDAQYYFDESMELFQALNNREGIANVSYYCGLLALQQGRPAEALTALQTAEEIQREIPLRRELARTLCLKNLVTEQINLTEWLELLDIALELELPAQQRDALLISVSGFAQRGDDERAAHLLAILRALKAATSHQVDFTLPYFNQLLAQYPVEPQQAEHIAAVLLRVRSSVHQSA